MTSINGAAITQHVPDQTCAYDAEDMRAIAMGLAAHGLTTHLTDARAGLDVTAVQSPSGRREAELIIDEDGYTELRYWNLAGTPPGQVVATALRVLAIVSAPQSPPSLEHRAGRDRPEARRPGRAGAGGRGPSRRPGPVVAVVDASGPTVGGRARR